MNKIVFEGDSRIWDNEGGATLPQKVDDVLDASYTIANIADTSAFSSIVACIARINSAAAPAYNSGASNNYLLISAGGVDLLANGRTPLQVYQDTITYCNAVRALGFKPVVATIPRVTAAAGGTTGNPLADQFNALLKEGWYGFAYGFVDFAAVLGNAEAGGVGGINFSLAQKTTLASAIANSLANLATNPPPVPRLKVVFEGDSRLLDALAVGSTVVTKFRDAAGSNYQVGTSAAIGETLQQMLTQITAQIQPLYDASKTYNFLCLNAGGNDIQINGRTGAQVYNDTVAYCNAVGALGFRPVPATIVRCKSTYGNAAAINAAVDAFNALLRAGWRSFASAIADLAADTRIDPEQLPDGVHFSNQQNIYAAQDFQAAVSGYLDANRVLPLGFRAAGNELFILVDEQNPANNSNAGVLTDYSSHGRDLTTNANFPTFQTNQANGKAVVRFNGTTNNPLRSPAGSFTLACGFVVLKINEATFSNYGGVLTDLSSIEFLVGNQGTANFFDLTPNEARMFEYRLSDKIYPHAATPAPMNSFKVLFFRLWKPVQTNGIQIGQDLFDTARRAKMDLAALILYSNNFCESDIRVNALALANYFGLTVEDVFPYQAVMKSPMTTSKIVLRSVSIGGQKVTRQKRGAKSSWELGFSSRKGFEYERAKEVWDAHSPNTPIIYRDYSFIPPKDFIVDLPDQIQKITNSINNVDFTMNIEER